MEVKDVPTLVPMMTGILSLSVMTPEAAIATTSEVVADYDWMMAVAKTPIINTSIGLCELAWVRILPERLEQRRLKERVSRRREQMKKYSRNNIVPSKSSIFRFGCVFVPNMMIYSLDLP